MSQIFQTQNGELEIVFLAIPGRIMGTDMSLLKCTTPVLYPSFAGTTEVHKCLYFND